MRYYNFSKVLSPKACLELGVIISHKDNETCILTCVKMPVGFNKNYIEDLLPAKLLHYEVVTPAYFKGLHAMMIRQFRLEALVKAVSSTHKRGEKSDLTLTKLFVYIALKALKKQASDIHFEPKSKGYKVKFRVDGILQLFCELDMHCMQAFMLFIKLKAGLAIDINKVAQDGSFSMKIGGKKLDFRISILPLVYGQSMVLRVLKRELFKLDLNTLSLDYEQKKLLLAACEKSAGFVLISGPTGSGKSTTLYATLNSFKDANKKIITIEDPAEQRLESLDQIELNEKADFTFHDALKSVLRHDPDIIMIGEIRDRFSLDTALKAANTGHLVFSTIHTNNALLCVNRLLDMGAKPYALESCLRLLIAQRLMRKLCECKERVHIDTQIEGIAIKGDYYGPGGCELCELSGYKGRIVLAELVWIDDELRELIGKQASFSELLKSARRKGFKQLLEVGIKKLESGESSLEELKRSLIF